MNLPLANLMFAPENWLLIAGIALLLFGKRLPEVGRSLGKGIIEFKKGLAGIEEDVSQASRQPAIGHNDRVALPSPSAAYKFDPYTGEPLQESD
jgi:sec-independent protein translocase protein TatA